LNSGFAAAEKTAVFARLFARPRMRFGMSFQDAYTKFASIFVASE